MVTFSPVDIILIVVYFAAVIFIGIRVTKKHKSDADEFFLAGRSLTLPIFVATLVSTWYGGILGVGEYSYRYGLSNWVVFGVPYYVFALVFALFLAKRIRATNLYTIPDKLEQAYDRRTAIAGGVLTFFLVSPAAYVLMLGVLAKMIFGIPLPLAVLLTTLATVCYLYKGGFRSDIWVNAFEFILMFLGFALVIVFSYFKFGGLEYIRAHVPPLALTLTGGNSWQYMAVWFFIALWTLVDPAFYQRCYAAKDGKVARNGIFVSILFWLVFDFMTTAAGLYARAALPGLTQPMFSYPMLAEVALPSVAKGLFYIGMLATIMSTLSSLTLISAITVGQDIVGRWKQVPSNSLLVQRWTKLGLLFTALFSMALALIVPSVVSIWYTIGSCIIPGLLIPVLASYFHKLKIPPAYAFGAMLNGWFISTLSLVYGQLHRVDGTPTYLFGIEPMYPGLFMAFMWWAWGKMDRPAGKKEAEGT